MNVALVTGGSRGIGLGIARCLAAEGWNLVICGLRPESQVADAIGELRATGVDVLYCQADVSDRADRTALLGATREHFGRLNLLVNNAGVAPRVRADILEATEESYDRVMDINLKGPYFLTQAAAAWMIAMSGRPRPPGSGGWSAPAGGGVRPRVSNRASTSGGSIRSSSGGAARRSSALGGSQRSASGGSRRSGSSGGSRRG